MDKNDTIYLACSRALKIKSMGYNCAQACLGGLSSCLELDEGYAMKLMAAFGGGMRHQQLCGAVVGAGIALGLVFGSTQADAKADDRIGALTVGFINKFTEKFGTTTCGQLLTNKTETFYWDMPSDIGFKNDGDNQYGNAFNLKAPICGLAISSAVRFALEIIQKVR
mgnify:CR=1 FL=1